MKTRHFTPDPAARTRPSAEDKESFPLFLFILSAVTLCGFCYQFFIEVPSELVQRTFKEEWPAFLVDSLDRITVTAGSHPFLTFMGFLAAITPGLVFYHKARKYYYALSICTFLLWGTSFVLSERPTKRLGVAIQQILSSDREFPETIRGQ